MRERERERERERSRKTIRSNKIDEEIEKRFWIREGKSVCEKEIER